MRPNYARLLESTLFPDDALRPELSEIDALMIAKARQDVSHHKLDKWITAAIDELNDVKHAA